MVGVTEASLCVLLRDLLASRSGAAGSSRSAMGSGLQGVLAVLASSTHQESSPSATTQRTAGLASSARDPSDLLVFFL